MAITLDCSPADTIELAEFIEFIDKSYKKINLDALQDCASNLARLANNRMFLSSFIATELKKLQKFQVGNDYTAQTLMLGGVAGKFHIRANVWLPEHLLHKDNFEGEKKFYSFEYPHDHNFDFLTVGYFGKGYETDIYEYDRTRISGNIGESVPLRFLETTSLPEQKLMIYRAGQDLHVQKLPQQFSISINILCPARVGYDQFVFDVHQQTVSKVLRSNFSGQRWIVEAAAYLCDDNVSDVLLDIATKHPAKRLKELAQIALGRRWPDLANWARNRG